MTSIVTAKALMVREAVSLRAFGEKHGNKAIVYILDVVNSLSRSLERARMAHGELHIKWDIEKKETLTDPK